MAARTADAIINSYSNPVVITVPVEGADEFYRGAVVWTDLTNNGKATVAPASGDRPLGICTHHQTTTAANDEIEVVVNGIVEVPCAATITAADNSSLLVYDVNVAITDNTADAVSDLDATLEASDAVLGRILRADGSFAVIELSNLTGRIYSATLGWV